MVAASTLRTEPPHCSAPIVVDVSSAVPQGAQRCTNPIGSVRTTAVVRTPALKAFVYGSPCYTALDGICIQCHCVSDIDSLNRKNNRCRSPNTYLVPGQKSGFKCVKVGPAGPGSKLTTADPHYRTVNCLCRAPPISIVAKSLPRHDTLKCKRYCISIRN